MRALCADNRECGRLPTPVSGNLLPPERNRADTSTPSRGVPFPFGSAMPPRVKGTEVRLFDLFSPTEATVAAAEGDLPTVNDADHDGRRRGGVAAPGARHRPDRSPSEEIKRRQVALILRYVLNLRAR